MVFSSIPFLFFFFPACLVLYYLVPFKVKNIILLLFSLIFYSWGEPIYIVLMLFSSLVNYLTGIFIEKSKSDKVQKLILALCVIINLGLLGFFKYTNFFIDQVNAVTKAGIEAMEIALPIGISFYTFQNMRYSIDVYRKDYNAEKSFITYLAYITMFPQLIAGPIVRFSTVREELRNRTINLEKTSLGVARFLVGIFKKVLIANNIGMLWDTISAQSSDGLSIATAWLGAAAYTLQLYFDFSGYSDMAIGMGHMLGFTFNENFNYPLSAVSVTDFWRRWHISLSTWFRDYVYIPLGGNRKGKGRTLFNLLVVWTLTGFWHGAAWNFMIWGFYYGVLLILEKNVWGKLLNKLPSFFGHIYTLFIVVFGFTIFVFDDMTALSEYVKQMFGFTSTCFIDKGILEYLVNYGAVIILAAVFSFPVCKAVRERIESSESIALKRTAGVLTAVVYIALFVISISYIVNASYSPFLYFRF